MLYPLLLQPYYRHGAQTPWGGATLAALGKEIPDDTTGESCEVSALPGQASLVRNGPLAGKSLWEIAEEYGTELSGVAGDFPLLVKLIDARDRLSVQVHPGDAYAREKQGKLGKTEAWLVLAAEPGAVLYCGLDTKEDFVSLSADEEALQKAMRALPVHPGDVLYIPHGLVHAIGAGILLYEIQQSSDITYRVSDWGRLGTDGQPRQLHREDAVQVVRPALRSDPLPGASLVVEGGVATAYVCDANFALWRLNASGAMPLPEGKMLLLTVLSDCVLSWGDTQMSVQAYDSVCIPAACTGVTLRGRTHAILSTLADQEDLRSRLGSRASAVAGLCADVL